MIDPTQIKAKAERQYVEVLRSHLTGKVLFPIEFPAGSIPKDYLQLREAVSQLLDQSQDRIGYGYQVETESRKTQKYGCQTLPKRIYFETRADFLRFIKREKEFDQYAADVELILDTIPLLKDLLIQDPLMVVKYSDRWADLLKVCQYFQRNPRPHLYIRELPIAVHTKFIEQNKKILRRLLEFILPENQLQPLGEEQEHAFEKRFSLKYCEPLIRIRLLDPKLVFKHHFPAKEISLPISELETLNLPVGCCLITENLMNFLTLPPIANGLAIFGGGYGVTVLKTLGWLANCPIFYWGDLDADGFRILSALRSHFPQVIALMMDWETLQAFWQFIVPVASTDKEPVPLSYLNPQEQTLYTELLRQGKRLEQERISQPYVYQQLQRHQLPLLPPSSSGCTEN